VLHLIQRLKARFPAASKIRWDDTFLRSITTPRVCHVTTFVIHIIICLTLPHTLCDAHTTADASALCHPCRAMLPHERPTLKHNPVCIACSLFTCLAASFTRRAVDTRVQFLAPRHSTSPPRVHPTLKHVRVPVARAHMPRHAAPRRHHTCTLRSNTTPKL
jgi:hypothetical protein